MSTGQKQSQRTGNTNKQSMAQMSQGQRGTGMAAMSEGMISQHPLPSVLVVFGIGMGIGMVLASAMCESVAPPPSFGKRTELAAEKLGRQVLDAIAGVVPASLAKHIS
jgi:hypothetical protein